MKNAVGSNPGLANQYKQLCQQMELHGFEETIQCGRLFDSTWALKGIELCEPEGLQPGYAGPSSSSSLKVEANSSPQYWSIEQDRPAKSNVL